MADQVNPLVLWGGGAALVAAAFIAIPMVTGNDAPKGACELGSAGVAPVVTGLTHGESARAIASALGGVGANVACNAVVNSLEQEPAQPVSVSVDGTPQQVNVDQLQQLLATAQQDHALACLATYGFGNQNDIDCLCYAIAP